MAADTISLDNPCEFLWGNLTEEDIDNVLYAVGFLSRRVFCCDYAAAVTVLTKTGQMSKSLRGQLRRIRLPPEFDLGHDDDSSDGRSSNGDASPIEKESLRVVLLSSIEDEIERCMSQNMTRTGARFMMTPMTGVPEDVKDSGRTTLIGIYLRGMISLLRTLDVPIKCFEAFNTLMREAMANDAWYSGRYPELWIHLLESLTRFEKEPVAWQNIFLALNRHDIRIEHVWDALLAIVVLSPQDIPKLLDKANIGTLNACRVDDLILIFSLNMVYPGMTAKPYVNTVLSILQAWSPDNENLNLDLYQEPTATRKECSSPVELVTGECVELWSTKSPSPTRSEFLAVQEPQVWLTVPAVR